MTVEGLAKDRVQVNLALEVFIQIGLAALLVIGCLLILRPFIPLIMWGIIIAIASYPTFQKLQRALRGRGGLAAILWTLLLLAVLILPIFLMAQSLVEGIRPLAMGLKDGTLTILPPPDRIAHWPIIGPPLVRAWGMASTNFTDAVMRFTPQIRSVLPGILSASAGIGFTVLQFFLSVLVSGVSSGKRPSSRRRYSLTGQPPFRRSRTRVRAARGSHHPQRHFWNSRRCPHSIGPRGHWLPGDEIARSKRVGGGLSFRSCSSSGGADSHSRSDLRLYHRDYH